MPFLNIVSLVINELRKHFTHSTPEVMAQMNKDVFTKILCLKIILLTCQLNRQKALLFIMERGVCSIM